MTGGLQSKASRLCTGELVSRLLEGWLLALVSGILGSSRTLSLHRDWSVFLGVHKGRGHIAPLSMRVVETEKVSFSSHCCR